MPPVVLFLISSYILSYPTTPAIPTTDSVHFSSAFNVANRSSAALSGLFKTSSSNKSQPFRFDRKGSDPSSDSDSDGQDGDGDESDEESQVSKDDGAEWVWVRDCALWAAAIFVFWHFHFSCPISSSDTMVDHEENHRRMAKIDKDLKELEGEFDDGRRPCKIQVSAAYQTIQPLPFSLISNYSLFWWTWRKECLWIEVEQRSLLSSQSSDQFYRYSRSTLRVRFSLSTFLWHLK